jgi:hypothetical protein
VTITEQLDLSFNPFEKRGKHGEWGAGALLKAHDTASATAKRDAAAKHHGLEVPELSPPVADVKEFWGSLSDNDAAVLQDYIGQEGSAAINGALRAGKMPGVGKAEPSDADMLTQMLNPSAASSSGPTIDRSAEVPVLDRIIASHTVTKTTTLYRGMAMSPALAAQLKPGTVFTDKGFTSTSDSANWAGKFARLRVSGSDPMMGEVPALGGKPAVMDITVPAGSHMAPGDLGIKEYILPRGGSYRVDSISPDGGTYNLTALLPTSQQMIAGATPDNAVDVMRQLIATGMDPKAAGDAVSAQLKNQGKAEQTLQGLKAKGFANDSAGDAARAARLAWTEDEIEVQPPEEDAARQAALAGTVTGQLDLSAIHGHHIPGTDYTYRHGFKLLLPGSLPDPVLLKSFNDKYPQWMVDRDKEAKKAAAAASADCDHAATFVRASVRKTTKERYEEAPMIPNANSRRKLTPEQRKALKNHRVYTPPEDRDLYAPPARARGITAQALPGYSEVPGGLLSQRPPDGPPRLAAAGRARADAAALVGDVDPRADPALGSLAGIGAGEDAIKKYIDARIATEVARQVGEISAKQADDMKERLAQMHLAQQKTIAAIRSSYSSINDKGDHDLRAHTVANALFTFGGVAVAGVGIATGVAPILAALVAGLVPLVNVIHDYARNLG